MSESCACRRRVHLARDGVQGARRGFGQGRAQLCGQAVQDGRQASLGGRQVIQPGNQAAAIGGAEGERDDLAGEQRVDEPAGATLAGAWPSRGVEAMALGNGPQGRFVLGRQGAHASLPNAWACPNYLVVCQANYEQ